MSVRVIEPPARLVTLEEAKTFLRVLDDSDAETDNLISALIVAAQAEFDGPTGWVGRCFGEQRLEWTGGPLACEFRTPYPDLKSVVSVEARVGGQWQALPSASYQADDAGVVRPLAGAWPSMSASRVTYVAGMAAGDLRLQQVKTAILFHVKIHFYEGDFGERIRKSIDALLAPLRIYACP